MLSNNMSQVQQSFAMLYSYLIELGCATHESEDIELEALRQLLENNVFTAELEAAGYNLTQLEEQLAVVANDAQVVSRAELARLVTGCWSLPINSPKATPKDEQFGALGRSLYEVQTRLKFRPVTLRS